MPVTLHTTGDGTVFAVHEASGGATTVYEFSIEEEDGEKKATAENAHGARAREGFVSDAVSEALEAAGYTLADDPWTDGGCRDESVVNHVQFNLTLTVGGEPWELAACAGLNSGGDHQ